MKNENNEIRENATELRLLKKIFLTLFDHCSKISILGQIKQVNPTRRGGAFKAPPPKKMAISPLFMGPIEPKKFDFSYKLMPMPFA